MKFFTYPISPPEYDSDVYLYYCLRNSDTEHRNTYSARPESYTVCSLARCNESLELVQPSKWHVPVEDTRCGNKEPGFML